MSGAGAATKRSGLLGWFVGNPVAGNLLMVLFLLGGAIATTSLQTEVFPTLEPGAVQVTVVYPGAAPDDVEESITRRVEEAVLGLDGVERVRSSASEGVGRVTVELQDFADAQIVKDDVETAVDGLADFPPEDAEQPQIRVPQPVTTVVTLALTGPVDETTLREAGEQVERELLSRDGVSTARLRGVRSYEIAIEVSESALRRYALSFDEVAQAVRASSLDLSGGEIRTASGDILLRTDALRETGEAFEDIIVRSDPDGGLVRLTDLASIRDGFQDEPLISLVNGDPAVLVDVQFRGAEDLLEVREAAIGYIEEARPPEGVTIKVLRDESQVFRDRLSLLARNAVLGFTLVFLLLVLMLDLRLAFWVAMGVPISFLGGLALFWMLGGTLNFVSSFGLILVLGIVVDDAIVVGENTDRQLSKGMVGEAAAVEGVRGVLAPVLVGVLTTIAAFAPLIFSGGTFGEILRPVPILVICILGISLIEAFFILPGHLAHGGTWSRGPVARIQSRVAGWLHNFSEGVVRRWARFAGKRRYSVTAAGFAVILAVFSLALTGVVRLVFFPSIEAEVVTVDLTMPTGAPFEATERAARHMIDAAEAVAAEYEEQGEPVLRAWAATIGGRSSAGVGGPGAESTTSVEPNLAQIELTLFPAADRTISSQDIERAWRARIGEIAGAERLAFTSSAGPQDADIAYELAHPDNDVLEAAVSDLADRIAALNGVTEVDDGFDLGKRQLEFEITDAGAAAGLRPADIARQVRQAYFGEEVQRIQRGREEVRVFVRYPDSARRSLQELDALRLRTPDGGEIPLGVAAHITESRSFTSIERVDGRRIIELTANVDDAVVTPGEARAIVDAEIMPVISEAYPGLVSTLAGAGREQAEDLASLQRGLGIALVVMYALLASQLRSYVQPVVILMAVPFGAAGAIIGHGLLGLDLSFPSFMGMIALAGVVVNASIVLVDRYNQNVAAGEDPVEAVAEAASRRFRPILITTLTTALGLLPITLEQSPQAQFLVPMAVSLGTGLLFASTLIVLLVPAYVMIAEDVRGRKTGAALSSASEASPAP